MRPVILASAIAALLAGGCATSADKVAASYVSPTQYSSLTCPQIREEANRVSLRASQAAGAQDEKRRGDQVATVVGAVVFLPALFFIDGDNQQTAELARLKGEVGALEQASAQKGCGVDFEPRPAAGPAPRPAPARAR